MAASRFSRCCIAGASAGRAPRGRGGGRAAVGPGRAGSVIERDWTLLARNVNNLQLGETPVDRPARRQAACMRCARLGGVTVESRSCRMLRGLPSRASTHHPQEPPCDFPHSPLAAVALCLAAGSAAGAEDPAAGLHRARDRPAEGLPGRLQQGRIRTSRSSGCATRTGVITAKLLAEKANPQADAVMGVAASSLALLDKQGMLIPYAPINLDAIMSQYRDKKNPPAWFGMDVWGATVCFNTVEAQKRNIPKPETWKDLTKPVYKGQIVMPNPASSGTGFFDVTAWLTLWGDDNGKGGGWKYMDALHENIAQYTHSGSKPCNMAARRRVRGRHQLRVPRQHQQGQGRADRPGVPEGRPGLGPGVLRHPQGHEEARRGARSWPTGRRARTRCCCTARTSPSPRSPAWPRRWPTCPRTTRQRLVKMDFDWAADNRERILDRVEQALQRQERTEEVTPPQRPAAASPRGRRPRPGGAGPRRLLGAPSSVRSRLDALPQARRHPQGFRQLHRAARHRPRASPRASSSASSGPSGCGKTTLLRIIAGLEAQTRRAHRAGRARHLGAAAGAARLRHRLPVLRAVPQPERGRQRGLRPGQPQDAAGAGARSASTNCCKLVGLPGSQAKFPAQLSGGQQQRIALARALATSPGLLLLDEPLSALDAIVRVHLRQEIRSLQRKLGVTTIMVTHDQEEALAVADRIVVMNHGVIEQVGTPMEVYRDPAHALRRRFRRPHQRAAGDGWPRASRVLLRRQPFALPARRRAGQRGEGLPAARGRAGAADRRRRQQRLRGADRQDRVPRLVLPGARARRRRWASTG